MLRTPHNDRLELHGKGICDCKPCPWLTHGCLWRKDGGEGEFFWNERSKTKTANRVVVASHYEARNKKVISGILKFHVYQRGGNLYFESKGTYVPTSFRRRNIATYLWMLAIVRTDPDVIKVHVISDRGLTLIYSLRDKFTYIKWKVVEHARRKLRIL